MYIDVDVRICSDLIPLVSWSLDKYLVIFISAMFHVKKMSYTYLSVVDPTALRAHRSRSDFFFFGTAPCLTSWGSLEEGHLVIHPGSDSAARPVVAVNRLVSPDPDVAS